MVILAKIQCLENQRQRESPQNYNLYVQIYNMGWF